MKKHLTLFLFLFFTVQILVAQHTAQYSLYMLNPFAQNPAYAGLDNTLVANGVYRTQWVGLEGNPETQIFNAHLPIYIVNSGIGIQIENDVTGALQKTSASLAYNYQLAIAKNSILSIGLSGGLIQTSIDGQKLRTPEGTYDPDQNIIIHNDDLLPTGKESGIIPTFTAGAYFQGKKLEIGIGVLNLQEPLADFSNFGVKIKRSYYITAAYVLDLNRTLTLKPSVQVKSDIIQTQMEVSAIIDYKSKFFLGASYRGFSADSKDAIIALSGLKLNDKWTLAYAYDIGLSALKTISTGSHEVMLNYNFGKPIGKGIPPKIIYNPRF